MTKQRLLLWVVITVVLAGVVLPAHAAPGPKEPAPKVGQRAGAITALLPTATITRGSGKNLVTNEAKKGDELVWNDLLKTQKGGRARVTLTDQSILSLGSQAELKIVKHDDRSQQTALQLGYGRVRAEVSKITRQGGSFELRTPTAVAGVIGTDFGSDASSVGTTVFLCISGIVQVANSDPAVQGAVQCAPGLTTSVTAGKPPTIPSNATPQQIQQLVQDTEPAIISAMSPSSALPGTTVDAAIGGTKLGAVNAVSVTGTGITASLSGTPTATSVTVHLVIAPNATPGPHTITLSKPNGAASAAVFTIIQPPIAAGSGDLKKPYHDLFDQERQSKKAGLTALLASVQQAVDQTLQQLQAANQGNVVDLGPASQNLDAQITAIQNAINQAGGQVDQAVVAALATFDTQYTAAYNALLQRSPAGVPDATFNQALQAAFDQVNASLGQAFVNISSGLTTNVQAATQSVTQAQQTWLSTIAAASISPPTPMVNNIERAIDLGAAFGTGILAAPDASNSKGKSGASVTRYSWVLCDSSYKPPQFGVPIAATTPGCSPISGYASTNSDFPFATCNLTPNDYIARVTITDTNNQQAAMDVKIHVLAGAYDPPETRVRNLAAAYSTLQVSQFLAFFDETGFSGYTTLAENVRNTFPTLASMNINPRVSQATINCNDALVRADWVQNYTYQANPNISFSQSEQLTIGMARYPGRGWYINDFRGDNGKVQGQLPGPASTDSPQPNMVVTSVFATHAGVSSTAGQLVPPGPQSFTALVSNVGGADLSAATTVRFSLLDASNNTLASADVPLTIPLAVNATQPVTATLNVPNTLAIGAPFQVQATVNPGCSVPEAHCDAANTSIQPLIVGTPIKITQVNPLSFIAGGPAQTLQVTVSDKATVLLNLPAGMTTSSPNPQTLTAAGTLSWVIQATLNASAATPLAPMTVSSNVGIPILQAITYSIVGPTFTETATPALIAPGSAHALTVTVNVPGTYTLVLPAGITTSSANPQTITAATGGTLTWNLQASAAAAVGTSLTMPITAGAYSFSAAYSVTPIQVVEVGSLNLLAGGPAQVLQISVSDQATVLLNLPPGITTSSPNPQTLTAAGTLSWTLQASLNVAAGTGLTNITVSVTGVAIAQALAYAVTAPTFAETSTPALLSGGAAQVLTVTVNVPGTFTLTLPAGITTTSANPQTITAATGGTLTWNLQASFTALTGTSLSTPITAGVYIFNATYSVGAEANYVIQSIAFVGHTAPYTGAQAIQFGETFLINAVVANVGNGSPTGTITLTAMCSGGPAGACGGGNPPSTTIAAPAAGTTVTATITVTNSNLPPALYTGTVTLTTTIPQSSTADDALSVPFEGVDFNLSINQPFTGTQNVLVGGTAQISFKLDETGDPTPFPMLVTITTDNASVTFSPSSATVSPGVILTTTSGSPATAVPVTVVYSATNHGVTKNATQVLNYVSASITSTSLFLNDATNPLEVQMGGTTSISNPIVTLKLNSTPFGGTTNPATVAAPAPVSGFTSTVDSGATTLVSEGGTFQLQVSAAFGATPIVTSLPVVATLPNSLPPAQVSYNLFVKAIGVPDLQVVSVTPPRTLNSSTPWLSGEALNFSVVVKNNGNTASAGGESLTMLLNGFEVDNGTITVPALAPGASTTIPVHAVAPDVDSSSFTSSATTLKTKVDPDSVGDLNYANNTLTQSVTTANWHLAVSGAGSADGTPLIIVVTSSGTSWSNQALLNGAIDGGGTTALTFNPTPGVVSTNLSITGFTPATGPNSFLATVSTSASSFLSATQSGFYLAQVIVQLLDGVTVTAQRQATIHVSISNSFTSSLSYTLGLVCTHNADRCDPGAGPAVPIQVNGVLAEQYTVTVVPACTPNPLTGLTCQGTADVVVSDGSNTATTPPQVKGLPFNNPAVFQLAANQDANGDITAGAASGYAISLSGIQRSGTSPDAVGQTVSVPVNVGDITITANTGANSCTGVVPNGTPLQLTLTWNVLGGFNSPSLSWQWENANLSPVGASPVSFTSPSGTSSFGGGTYAALPTFTLTNTLAQDGLVGYFFSVTISNGTTSATKYFPFYFDLSTTQNFCGAVGGVRGRGTINGTWSRSAAGSGGSTSLASRLVPGTAGSVDLHLSASDVSFTPSVPKYGDTVQVRFRVRNEGSGDAKGVPIALLVNGAIVASDTFDVAAGHSTLGGLQWNTTAAAASAVTPSRAAAVRPLRSGRRGGVAAVAEMPPDDTPAVTTGLAHLNAVLVVDPRHSVQQKTTLDKSVPLAHFTMRSPSDAAIAGVSGGSQRILLEIQDGACAGLRLATGSVGPCGSADVELTIADIAKASYMLNTTTGIADLGATFGGIPGAGGARFSSELAGLAGHSYAVQLSGGRTAVVTIDSIRNPGQLDAATRAVFRSSAVLILRGMGADSGAAATGDVASGSRRGATVFVQLTVQAQ